MSKKAIASIIILELSAWIPLASNTLGVKGRCQALSLDSLSRGQTSRIKHFPVPGFYRERSGLLRYIFRCRSRVFTPNFALIGRGFYYFL
jgi:hypothetical protein